MIIVSVSTGIISFIFGQIKNKINPEMGKSSVSMNKGSLGILMIVLLLCLQRNGFGQETVKIKRISGAVEFDGIPNEQVWKELDQFPLTMHKPNFGSHPSELSDVRIGDQVWNCPGQRDLVHGRCKYRTDT